MTRVWAIACATIAVTAPCLAQSVEPITGRASVIDGDTIDIAGRRIRIQGIDAPESRQQCSNAAGVAYPCGREAAAALDTFLAESRPTTCQPVEKDRYDRLVATCARADGEGVAEFMVRSGWALDWPRYSDGAYANEEFAANDDKAGMWQGEFKRPWDWRGRQ